jgi:hypothetical protein
MEASIEVDSWTKDIEEMQAKAKLRYKWVIWENWQKQSTGEESKEYVSNMQPVAEFDNAISFWQVWNAVPHADPSHYFIDCENLKSKQ